MDKIDAIYLYEEDKNQQLKFKEEQEEKKRKEGKVIHARHVWH